MGCKCGGAVHASVDRVLAGRGDILYERVVSDCVDAIVF